MPMGNRDQSRALHDSGSHFRLSVLGRSTWEPGEGVVGVLGR